MKLGTAALLTCGSKAPASPGTPYGGGFYVGRLKVDGVSYALIVSSKASGESSATLQAKAVNSATPGTDSVWDGAANQAAMMAAGVPALHPAAQFCENLTIGGYDDWVLPARDQLELCYRNLKPGTLSNNTVSGINGSSDPAGNYYTAGMPAQTSLVAFKTGGAEAFEIGSYYWSSTQSGTLSYYQRFDDGGQPTGNKNTGYKVRAVRMVRI